MKNKSALLDKLDQSLSHPAAEAADVLLPPPAPEAAVLSLRPQAEALVNRAVLWSMGAGLIPLPALDGTAVFAIQLKLVRDLAKLYSIDTTEDKVKGILASLAGGGLTALVTRGTLGASLPFIPLIGPVLALAASPVCSAATTLAVGKVFTAQFESKGRLLSVDFGGIKSEFCRELTDARTGIKQGAVNFIDTFKPQRA